MSKTFVSDWLVAEVNAYHQEHGTPVSQTDIRRCNRHFYHKYPEMATRTLRNATKAVREENYRTDMAQNHFTALPTQSIIPDSYSDFDKYISMMKELIAKCKQDRRRIKLVNAQDLHLEHVTDNAVLNLLFQVVDDFDPDYIPVLADLIDNTLLQAVIHGTNIAEVETEHELDAQSFFQEATFWYLDALNSVAPQAIKPTWMGNHEWWLLRHFLQSGTSPAYFLRYFMKGFKERGGLWLEGDKRTEIPITDNVIGIHGWMARTATYGSTANGYMKHYGGYKSVFAGHSHRPETVWSRPHPDTQGRNFVNICGTLGSVRPKFMKQRYVGHVQEFVLARLAPSGNLGHEITPVSINYDDGYYFCYADGKLYREKANEEPNWLNPLRES